MVRPEGESDAGGRLGRADLAAAAGLFALIAAALAPNVLDSSLPFRLMREFNTQWYPYHFFFRRSLGEGVAPLWSSNIFCGFPLYAFSHAQILYPLSLRFLPPAAWIFSYWFLHLGLGTAGVYLLMRRLALGRPAAFAAAVMSLVNALTFMAWLPGLAVMSLLPWLLLFNLALARRPRLGALLGFSLTLALLILAGQSEALVYALLEVGLVTLIFHICGVSRISRGYLAATAAAGALALVLSSSQWVPLREYLGHCIRSQGLTREYYLEQVKLFFRPSELLLSLLPVELNLATRPISLAVPLLFFAALVPAFVYKPRRRAAILLVAATMIFYLLTISSLPFRRLAFYLPVLNQLVRPQISVPIIFLMPLLAVGFGLDTMMAGRSRVAFGAWLITALGGAVINIVAAAFFEPAPYRFVFGALFAVLAVLLVAWRGREKRAARVAVAILAVALLEPLVWFHRTNAHLPIQAVDKSRVLSPIRGHEGRFAFISRLGPFDPDLPFQQGVYSNQDEILGLITIPPRRLMELWSELDPELIRFHRGRLDSYTAYSELHNGEFLSRKTFPFLCLLNLKYVFSRDQIFSLMSPYPMEPYLRRESSFKLFPGGGLDHDIALKGGSPVYCWDESPGDRLEADLACAEAWREREVVLSLATVSADGGASVSASWALPPGEVSRPIVWEPKGVPGKRCISFSAQPDAACKLLFPRLALPWAPFVLKSGSEVKLFENRDALPRTFMVHEAFLADDQQARQFVAASDVRALAGKIALSGVPGPGRPAPEFVRGVFREPAGLDRVDKITSKSGLTRFRVHAATPGFMFVSENYYPGWRAWLDGAEVRVLRADYAFRAVFVLAGEHTVTFKFEPASLRLTLWASLAALACWLFVGLMKWRMEARNGKEKEG
ncbi:MAG TPA: hypothetical protein VM658_14115 [bacterium]|nr:hypothetical protein [bacterium]